MPSFSIRPFQFSVPKQQVPMNHPVNETHCSANLFMKVSAFIFSSGDWVRSEMTV